MTLFKHKEIFYTKNILMLAHVIGFWSNFVIRFRSTPDNLTLADRFYYGRVYLLVQGRQFAAPLRCRPPASGVSGGGRYATDYTGVENSDSPLISTAFQEHVSLDLDRFSHKFRTN